MVDCWHLARGATFADATHWRESCNSVSSEAPQSVSYHETFEFFAIDRCLTVAQMRALRRISTRATITPNRFFNSYHWGGLKGNPRDMLRRYFDLFVHTGNGIPDCGMLRLPFRAITIASWRPFVAVPRDDESADQASWPVPLALIRSRLLAGDLSPLYLLWLLSVQYGDRRATAAEPPRPPGLDRRDGALHLFAEFLGLNASLLMTALEDPPAAPRSAGQLLDAARARAAPSRRGGRTRSTGR
ncbi:MAG: hypothetical protein AABZ29_08620 [Gemmatimonadota bacterium]